MALRTDTKTLAKKRCLHEAQKPRWGHGPRRDFRSHEWPGLVHVGTQRAADICHKTTVVRKTLKRDDRLLISE